MIPFSIAKNDPENFYNEMIAHTKFLHEHRCITINNVPPSDFSSTLQTTTQLDDEGKTLHHALANNKKIDRIHIHTDKTNVMIALNANNLAPVEEWLDEILPTFPYGPTRDKNTSNTSIGTNTTRSGKYSKLFTKNKENDSTAGSFDPSTIASTISPRSKNSWNQGPPMNVSFNRQQRNRVTLNVESDESPRNDDQDIIAERSDTGSYGSTTYGRSNWSRTASIQSDVSTMVEKALATERAALQAKFEALEKQQNEFNIKVKEWDTKMEEMKKEIVESTVKGTVTLLTGSMTPFATKEDNIQLQEQTNKVIHTAVSTTNHEIAGLKEGISELLQRTNRLFASIHNPDETSPPRKMRQPSDRESPPTSPVRLFPADSDMTIMDGVSED